MEQATGSLSIDRPAFLGAKGAWAPCTPSWLIPISRICHPSPVADPSPNQETDESRAYHASLPTQVREALDTVHAAEHDIQYRDFPDNSNLYWIAFLATSPKAQGRGLAKALLATLRERAARDGRVVALLTQTAENVSDSMRRGKIAWDAEGQRGWRVG